MQLFYDPADERSVAMARMVADAGLPCTWYTVDSAALEAHFGPVENASPAPAKVAHRQADTERWLSRAPSVELRGEPGLDAAIEAGVFALPTLVVDGFRYWGPERFASAVARHRGELLPRPSVLEGVQLFHDFASPYSYLGTVPLLDSGVVLRPMLLGAVFKTIGAPLIPMATFGETRRAWAAWDLGETARLRGLPFRFTSHFPLNTVTALRLAILEPSLTAPLYRAAWAEDRDLGDVDVLRAILAENDQPADLLERTAEVKHILRQNTEEAVRIGVPGAPTYQLDGAVYWGQDRIPLLS